MQPLIPLKVDTPTCRQARQLHPQQVAHCVELPKSFLFRATEGCVRKINRLLAWKLIFTCL